MNKVRAHRNRTTTVNRAGTKHCSRDLTHISKPVDTNAISSAVVNEDVFESLAFCPGSYVDLLTLDLPYTLATTSAMTAFGEKHTAEWSGSLMTKPNPTIRNAASVDVCPEQYSTVRYLVLHKLPKLRIGIT